MSASFEIASSTGAYRVTVEHGSFARIVQAAGHRLVLADEYFAPLLKSAGVDAIAVASSESVKSLDAMPAVITEMRRRGANRKTELLAMGGGIVQDVSAFAASVFMRGIAWRYLPTTVLAMADSCIGGKSSINVGPYKNLIGTFHPPQEILIDPTFADTLTPEQRSAGLIEAGKICFCRGDRAFSDYLSLHPSPFMDGAAIEPVLIASLMAKKWFIETDEFDRAERLLLNFGHTFGHAIEGATHFRVSHGAAVAVGILCALAFRSAEGGPSVERVAQLEEHMRDLLSANPGVAAELAQTSIVDIADRFEADKKHTSTDYTLILPDAAGAIALTRYPKNAATREKIERAIKTAFQTLNR